MRLLIVGLFLKVVLADRLFWPVANFVYSPTIHPDAVSSWGGTMAFGGQIYCDFAGYSTCAIGAAMCLGFALQDNFRWPVASIGFIDFWRRAHISLSTWLRDYVYFSLGGNRQGALRSYISLMITMIAAGLWHGASWTFVTFGALHGTGLITEHTLRATPLARLDVWKHPIMKFGMAAFTTTLITWTCVFFRSTTMSQATNIAATMIGWGPSEGISRIDDHELLTVVILIEVMFLIHFFMRDTTLEHAVARMPSWLWGLMLAGMMICLVLMPGEGNAYIYFQF